jgi:hypothetical protein
MGLTIHYTIETPKTWTHNQTVEKLHIVQEFAKTLDFVEVTDVVELKDKECEIEFGKRDDPHGWAKIQGQRHIDNPWKPGVSRSQSPNRMVFFSIWPDEGCEEMNVGICSYPRDVWKGETEIDYLNWSSALGKYANKNSKKILKSFLKKWNLRKSPQPKGYYRHRFIGAKYSVQGWANADIVSGRYISHRKGYAPNIGIVSFRDQMQYSLNFKYQGTAEEATQVFSDKEFQSDLRDLVFGKEYVNPAEFGKWRSFCKTQYSNNFLKAHLGVCAILEKLQEIGFKVSVSDEGDFWEKRDVKALVAEVAEWDAMIAAFTGALKDITPKGMALECPIFERPDFEHLEMKGQGKIAEFLKILNAAKAKIQTT